MQASINQLMQVVGGILVAMPTAIPVETTAGSARGNTTDSSMRHHSWDDNDRVFGQTFHQRFCGSGHAGFGIPCSRRVIAGSILPKLPGLQQADSVDVKIPIYRHSVVNRIAVRR
jgi:hypothetical protein